MPRSPSRAVDVGRARGEDTTVRTLLLPDPDATHALGLALAEALRPGVFVALHGDLGAGKTALARAIARGLGVTGIVASPTYNLVHSYDGRLPLHHADWYRLADEDELEQIGWFELAGPEAVALVEWSSRVPEAVPPDHLAVTLDHEGEGRRVRLEAHGPCARAVLEALRA